MYHRFNESKYPSTNIQMEIFKEHIELIKDLILISIIQKNLSRNLINQKNKKKFC